jgi:hypothetical protein
MKRLIIILSFLTAFGIVSKLNAAPPVEVEGRFGYFYSSLAPYGEWIELEPGFEVWRPLNVDEHWRPYLFGRWVWTDYGWYWMSHEPFGWITYHYGRWYNDDFYGWVWVPDDVWGPAWVDWRYDDDYIGWAPLPPYAVFRFGVGIHFTRQWEAPYHYWCFIPYHRFGAILHFRDIRPEDHTRRLLQTTRSGQRYEFDHDRIINRGVDRGIIERRGNVRIPLSEVLETNSRSGERLVRQRGDATRQRIEINRLSPEDIQRSQGRVEMRRGERTPSLEIGKVERSQNLPRTPREGLTPRPEVSQPIPMPPHRDQSIPHEELRRDYTPHVVEPRVQKERQELRKELLQRHEPRERVAPPANVDRQDRTSRQTNPERSAPRMERSQEESRQAQPQPESSGRESTRSPERQRSR